ncbi:MAG TPA: hypothetical protein VGM39_00460 [Kofleriaceae bacterium]|jgi:hypothetical protein
MKQLVLVVALLGCKKPEAPPAGGSGSAAPAKDERDEMLTKMTEFTDRVCACADAGCMGKVNDELQKWTVDFAAKTSGSTAVPTPEQLKKVEELQGKFVQCARKLSPEDGSGSAQSDMSTACQRFLIAANGELDCLKLEKPQQDEMRELLGQVIQAGTAAACDDGYEKVKAHAKAWRCPMPE